MTAEEEKIFQLSNVCWICNKLFDAADDKVRHHCHVSGKYRDAAHWSCNVNLKMIKNTPVIFHNLKGYDVKISVIPNGLDKIHGFYNK